MAEWIRFLQRCKPAVMSDQSEAQQPDQQPSARPPSRPASISGRVALVLSIVALAATAAQWFGAERYFLPEQGAEGTVSTAEIRQLSSSAEQQRQRVTADMDSLRERLQRLEEDPDNLAARIDRIEAQQQEATASNRGRAMWLATQAVHFLRLANAQARLAHDSQGSLAALETADEYLREADDPRFLPVRKLISSEQAALRAVDAVDVAGISLRLETLADQVRSLSPRQAPDSFRAPASTPPEDLSGGERAVHAIQKAFSSVVVVRRDDGTEPLVLPDPETSGLVAQGLGLELQLARLALLRGQSSSLKRSLDEVRRQLRRHYDTSSGAAAAVLAGITAISNTPLTEEIPDISGSLTEMTRILELDGSS